MSKWLVGAALAAMVVAGTAWAAVDLTPDSPDPFLWLTDIHGAKAVAWAREQTDKSLAILKGDPAYQKDHDSILKVLDANDRIAEGQLDHGDVLNFWQDASHPRGMWRKTTIADYRNVQPKWDVLLDVDALDAAEKQPWVWQGADCAPGNTNCLVRLSPGGGDAATVREFNPEAKTFIKDGFALSLSKLNATYIDKDTVLFGTDFGPGTMTKSSYPRIVKLWHRGQNLADAKIVYEAKPDDISATPITFHGPYGTIALVARGVTFFTSEYYYVLPDGSTMKLPLPLGADLKGVTNGNLIFTLRDAWTPPGGKPIAQGALVAFPVKPFVMQKMLPAFAVLYTPNERSTVSDVSTGRDAVYASIFENVTGSIHEFRPGANGAWSDTKLNMPQGGSTGVVSTNDWGPEAYFTFESFLKPVTLYAYDGAGKPAEIKSEPARFDASNMASDQFWATSADGTKVPYF
jgi:prolyl oligopeptidase